MEPVKIITQNSPTNKLTSSDLTFAEFEFFDHHYRFFRVQVYNTYIENDTRYKRFVYVAEHLGTLEVGGQVYRITEGDMIMIEKGYRQRWSGQMSLIIFVPEL